MKRHTRSLFACLLSVLILVTSGTMAVARGHAMVAGQIVICTGYGPKVITVDADNQPVGPALYCPDCALSFMDLAPTETPETQSLSRVLKLRFYAVTAGAQCQDCDVSQFARGPPLSV